MRLLGTLRKAAVIAAALLAGACTPTPDLPPLPGLDALGFSDALPAVREHVETAWRDVDASPKDAALNGQLGMVLSTYRRSTDGLALYQRARALDPESFRWAYYEAFSLLDLGQSLDAISAFERALEIDPGHPGARAKLAALKLTVGDAEQSRALFAELADEYPDRADVQLGLGRALYALDQDQAALDALNAALRIAPEAGDVHYALAQTYQRLGDEAGATLHRQLHQRFETNRLRPHDPLLLAVGNLNRSDAPHMARGRYFASINRLEDAVGQFEAAIAVNPDNASAHSELVETLVALSEFEQAQQAYAEGLAHAASYAPLHLGGGNAFFATGQYAEAEQALNRANELDPEIAEIHRALASVQTLSGNLDAALENFRRAHELKPDFRAYRHHYGKALHEAGLNEQAVDILEPLAAKLSADSPAHLLTLAAAYKGAGDSATAVETLKTAQKLARDTGDVRRALEAEGLLNEWR